MRHRYWSSLAVLVAALVLAAVTASSALAAPEWYSSTTATKAEWQQAGAKISEAVATKWKGTVEVTDPQYYKTRVRCEDAGEGTVGPGAVAKMSTWTVSKCAIVEGGCEVLETVKVTGTPWTTELVFPKGSREGAELGDVASNEGKSILGMNFYCNTVALGKVQDSCTSKEVFLSVRNTTGGVEATFGSPGNVKCFALDVSDNGTFAGTQHIEAVKGGTLEAKVVEGSFSKVTSALKVKGAGELTVEDLGGYPGPLGATCGFETEGTVAAGGKGTITSFFKPNTCSPVGSGCTNVGIVESVGLPWNTELYESEGRLRNRIVSGGKETPGWKFECETSEGKMTDICYLDVSPVLENGLGGGVFAVFSDTLTKVYCTDDGYGEGRGEWQGELTLTPVSGAIKVKK